MREIFLGTGANGGTPQIDCRCESCDAATRVQTLRRLRSSLLVDTSKGNLLLDCGPDIREQLISENLRLQDISLISITHLHPDHSIGLWELSGGKALEVPVLIPPQYLENDRQIIKQMMPSLLFLERASFIKFVSREDSEKLGVKLIDVPHDPNFPTCAVVIKDQGKSLWYSPDVLNITQGMAETIRETDLIVFDSTFLNDEKASKYNHTTIEISAPQLAELNQNVIYSHINHSENPNKVKNYVDQFGFTLAEDWQKETS